MMGLKCLTFCLDIPRSKVNEHPWFDNTRFYSAYRDSSDATNLVDILQGESKWFVDWFLGRFEGV